MLVIICSILIVSYTLFCGIMYLLQERIIFKPSPVNPTEDSSPGKASKEIKMESFDGTELSGLLVESEQNSGKNLLFYLHGNRASIYEMEGVGEFYTALGYDFFTFDYRGFGKSQGKPYSENQFFKDVLLVYNSMVDMAAYENIVVMGYSLGSCAAAMLAKQKNPSKLILLAPYHSLANVTIHRYKILPTSLLKYPFKTHYFLKQVECPVLLIHGKEDQSLPFKGSKKLSKLLKKSDLFIPIENQGHLYFEVNPEFKNAVTSFL